MRGKEEGIPMAHSARIIGQARFCSPLPTGGWEDNGRLNYK